MKKILILAAVLGLTVSATGCECLRAIFRGRQAEPCAPVCAPCPTACDPCSAGPVMTQGADYAPGPVGP